MNSRQMWLAPDLALTFGLIALLSLFLVCGGAITLFSDSDTGWHIRNGQRILATRSLPRTDPFSFSKQGEAWIAWEWGSDVIMAAAYCAGGLGGVALLFGLSIGASVWMWFRLSQAAGGNILLAFLFLWPMLAATTLHWVARPHIFSWLFLIGIVWVCERTPRLFGWRWLTLTAVLAALWANLHASFFFAPMVALIYALGACLRPLIWQVNQSPLQPNAGRTGRRYVPLALAAAVGTLANPNGWRLHQHVLSYLLDTGLLRRITEFQSFNFYSSEALAVMLMLAICFAGAFAALWAHNLERFLLSISLIALGLRSTRALPVAALLLLPLANSSITAVLKRAADLKPRLRHALDAALDYGDGLEKIQRGFHGYGLIPVALVLIFACIRTSARFPAMEFPVAASAMVAALPANARILAPDTFGGYLIYRFNGDRKVFVDGRSDFYGSEFSGRYLRLMEVLPGWREELNRWKFSNALLPSDSPLISALEISGWHELFRDRTAVLMTRTAEVKHLQRSSGL